MKKKILPDPCLVQYCPKGHECTLDESGEVALCVCQRQCPPVNRKKLVCGSDGHIYPNHCEMHRAACLKATTISVQRGVHCIKQGKGWAPGLETEMVDKTFTLTEQRKNVENITLPGDVTTEMVFVLRLSNNVLVFFFCLNLIKTWRE